MTSFKISGTETTDDVVTFSYGCLKRIVQPRVVHCYTCNTFDMHGNTHDAAILV